MAEIFRRSVSLIIILILLSSVLFLFSSSNVKGYWQVSTTEYNTYQNISEGDYETSRVTVEDDRINFAGRIEFFASEGSYIDIFLVNESNFEKYKNNETFTTIKEYLNVENQSFSGSFSTPNTTYYWVYDNTETFTNPPNNSKDDYVVIHIRVIQEEYRWVVDSDSDFHPDDEDAFPNDRYEWQDTDGDGVGNNADKIDDNPTQWDDRDGDGYGDNASGIDPDALPDDPAEWNDTDSDGFGDNGDVFPDDPSENLDTDGDGIGNNEDTDDDNDGVEDSKDLDPLDSNVSKEEIDIPMPYIVIILGCAVIGIVLYAAFRKPKQPQYKKEDHDFLYPDKMDDGPKPGR